MKKRKTQEKIDEIKKLRMGRGFFTCQDMADMFVKKGHAMTRQSYCNKETGATKFTAEEVRILGEVFGMDLRDVIRIFNDWDLLYGK